ncbi:phage tail fiber protein [Aeromonas veronii]|uniref:phage tail fiber protein n=1 Tax=Aeromonas veronii TaxID=654 RepID=UPI003D1F6B3F
MSAFSDYLEEKLLSATLCGKAYSPPTQHFIALYTSATSDVGDSGNEVVGGDYARIRVLFAAPSKGADGDFFCTNDGDVRSPKPSTQPWGRITHFAIYDAPVGGNRLYHGALREARDIGVNDLFFVLSGDLKITLS